MYIEILRENLNSVSCIKACIDYLYVDHAVNAAEYCKILHLKPQWTGNVIKNKWKRSCAMDFVPFLNPCMLIQTIGKKKKKERKNEQTKKSLYTTKTLLKNQRQHLVDGWVFLFACFLCFSTSFALGRCPLLILGYGGSTAPGLEGDLVEQWEFHYCLCMWSLKTCSQDTSGNRNKVIWLLEMCFMYFGKTTLWFQFKGCEGSGTCGKGGGNFPHASQDSSSSKAESSLCRRVTVWEEEPG